MTKDTVRFTVEFTIHEGKLNQFEELARTMVERSQLEPGTLGYDFFLSEDRKRCRLLETYADGDAVVKHLAGPVVQEFVPKMLETAGLTRFEVYGDPGPKAAQMLKGMGAETFNPWHKLSR